MTLPAAVALARTARAIELLDAAYAIPLGGALAIAALLLARAGRRRVERTLGRVGGRRVAVVGKVLGLLGLALALAGAIAVATYAVLAHVAE